MSHTPLTRTPRVRRPTMNEESGAPAPGGSLLGRYANYFEVGHNAFEFLLDFGQFYAEDGRARVHTRIIMSPTYAKALFRTFEQSLVRYEQSFGSIEDHLPPPGP